MTMTELPADMHAEAYWAMCEDGEVAALLAQLVAGLIHPLEYADAVKRIAIKYNIQ